MLFVPSLSIFLGWPEDPANAQEVDGCVVVELKEIHLLVRKLSGGVRATMRAPISGIKRASSLRSNLSRTVSTQSVHSPRLGADLPTTCPAYMTSMEASRGILHEEQSPCDVSLVEIFLDPGPRQRRHAWTMCMECYTL